MTRLKPFVVLDVLATLPLFVWAAYDTFRHPLDAGDFWFQVVVLGMMLVVMLPSVLCVVGLSLGPVLAIGCILLYLLLLVFMWFRTLQGWNEPHHATLVRLGICLLIAKSIYGAVSVTRRDIE